LTPGLILGGTDTWWDRHQDNIGDVSLRVREVTLRDGRLILDVKWDG
jgi:hypothetical protein